MNFNQTINYAIQFFSSTALFYFFLFFLSMLHDLSPVCCLLEYVLMKNDIVFNENAVIIQYCMLYIKNARECLTMI